MTIEPIRIAEVMGGPRVIGRRVSSIQDLALAVAQGLPKEALKHTVRRVFSQPKEANEVMHRIVPVATYKRRRTRMKARESERTERLARVIASAEFVWNNPEKAHRWLVKPHPELGRIAPVDCAFSELGARQVEELLGRIFYGLPL